SYRQFLRLHNGWKNFHNGMTLVGVSGPHTEKALGNFRKLDNEFLRSWKAAGRSTEPDFIASYQAQATDGETLEDAKLYLPALLKFGTGFANDYIALNPLRTTNDEPEVLSVYFLTKIVQRSQDFVAFLERTLAGYTVRGY